MFNFGKNNKDNNLDKNHENINWLLVRVSGDHLIQNLIIDERLFTFMVMREIYPGQAYLSIIGKNLGWHSGEDGEIYDKFALNTDRFGSYFKDDGSNFIKEYKIYLKMLNKFLNNINDGSKEYLILKQYFRKGQVKELCMYNECCEKPKNYNKEIEL